MKNHSYKVLSAALCLFLVFNIGLPVAFAADTPCTGCTITDPSVEEPFTKGSGTADDPWQIENIKQLNHMEQHQQGYFIQMNDLDFADADLNKDKPGNFDPISAVSGYDGNGKKIKGLVIDAGENQYGALFGFVQDIVKDLTLEGGTICGGGFESRIGGIAGENGGTIEGCINKNDIASKAGKSYACVGGIAGYNDRFGKIQSCENYGEIEGKENNFIAGIAGNNTGRIDNCTNFANIGDINTNTSAAGIAGENSKENGEDKDETHGVIQNCTNEGTIEGYVGVAGITVLNFHKVSHCTNNGKVAAESGAAGIVTQNSGPIEYCTNTGEITSADIGAAGVASYNGGESAILQYCRNLGKITGGKLNSGDYQHVGGLAGDNAGIIHDSYNAGEINGRCFVGGLVELNRGLLENCFNIGNITLGSGIADMNYDTIKYCYNTGHVSHGGIAGHNFGTISKSYYKQQTNIPGVYEPWGNAGYNAVSLTQELMKQVPPYAGWDFNTIWSQAADKNNGYPILRAFHAGMAENADLWELKVNGETVKGFSPSTTAYTVYLPFTAWTAAINATPLYGNSKITEGAGTFRLNVGENLIHVSVRAKNGSQKTYSLTLNRSEEKILPGVSIQGIPITPVFNANKTRYSAHVPYTTTSVLLRYTPLKSGETSKGTGVKRLHTGYNTYNIKVIQANKKSRTYQIKIYRAKPSSNNKLAYVTVNDKDATPYYNPKPWPGIKYGADANTNVATARIRAGVADPTATILSGTGDFPLKYGYNYFKIVTKAQNGSKRTFHVRVFRYYPAGYNNLKSISVSKGSLTPNFSGDKPYYTLQLNKDTSSVRITAAKAYTGPKMTGAPVTVRLKPGQRKVVKIKVSSGAGYMIYTITVKRAKA